MKTEKFEKKIQHLSQIEILSGAIDSLNKLLVDKEIITENELQTYFEEWLQQHKPPRKKPLSYDKLLSLEDKHTAFIGHPSSTSLSKKRKTRKK